MRGQSHRNFCGPACIANILRSYGYYPNATEDMVAKKIRQVATQQDEDPSNGTTEWQLRRACEGYKLPAEQFQLHEPHIAVLALQGLLVNGMRAVLCVDNGAHWVAAIGVCGKHILVADPAHPELVLSLTGEQLAERWKLTANPPGYYALVIHPRRNGRPKNA